MFKQRLMILATSGLTVATPLFGTSDTQNRVREWFEDLFRGARRRRPPRCYVCRTALEDGDSDMCPPCEDNWIIDAQW
ncbi:hypothetical protein D806_050240 [Mycolicibacterium smegmatis MKD8]|jgi:hypothetical protein|uniref:Uncharacterized protein n=1 Tax=Mycolicibacterium smegmatis (strain MKD8) TaxID=1214915 RepID=A0A2U9PW66_MYCSE|nr:hypothetical protein D806_050240 [Mycolicibacterium smegmatis MKD8]